MDIVSEYARFKVDENFVRASKNGVSARVVGDHILVWAHDMDDVPRHFYQTKRVIRLPRIIGTIHADLVLYYGFDDYDEWLHSYDLEAIIRPKHQDDFMYEHSINHVKVVTSEELASIKWRADRDSVTDTWDKVFSDGERHNIKVSKIGNRYYVYFYLRGATWAIQEDRGRSWVTRTLYTTRSDWWDMVLYPPDEKEKENNLKILNNLNRSNFKVSEDDFDLDYFTQEYFDQEGNLYKVYQIKGSTIKVFFAEHDHNYDKVVGYKANGNLIKWL